MISPETLAGLERMYIMGVQTRDPKLKFTSPPFVLGKCKDVNVFEPYSEIISDMYMGTFLISSPCLESLKKCRG